MICTSPSLQLWNAFTLTTLASAPYRVIGGGATPWYTILLQYLPGNILAGYVNGEKLVTVSDLTLSGGGYPGLYATFSATFSSLSVNVPCTVGTCSPTTVQGVCQFTCPTGYVASSNGTLVCTMASSGAAASWSGPSLTCTLPPPVFYGAYISTPGAWVVARAGREGGLCDPGPPFFLRYFRVSTRRRRRRPAPHRDILFALVDCPFHDRVG